MRVVAPLIVVAVSLAACHAPSPAAVREQAPVSTGEPEHATRWVRFDERELTLPGMRAAIGASGHDVSAHVAIRVAPGVAYEQTVALIDILLSAGFTDIGLAESASLEGVQWAVDVSG